MNNINRQLAKAELMDAFMETVVSRDQYKDYLVMNLIRFARTKGFDDPDFSVLASVYGLHKENEKLIFPS